MGINEQQIILFTLQQALVPHKLDKCFDILTEQLLIDAPNYILFLENMGNGGEITRTTDILALMASKDWA